MCIPALWGGSFIPAEFGIPPGIQPQKYSSGALTGFEATNVMVFNPRNPILGSKRAKNFGILGHMGPERAFLAFFQGFLAFFIF